jgi:hypothetical protein
MDRVKKPEMRTFMFAFIGWTVLVLGLMSWFQFYMNQNDPEIRQRGQFWIGATGVWGLIWIPVIMIGGYYSVKLMHHYTDGFMNNTAKFYTNVEIKLEQILQSVRNVDKLENSVTSLTSVLANVARSITSVRNI